MKEQKLCYVIYLYNTAIYKYIQTFMCSFFGDIYKTHKNKAQKYYLSYKLKVYFPPSQFCLALPQSRATINTVQIPNLRKK